MQPKIAGKPLRLILVAALAVVTLAIAIPYSYAYYEQSFAMSVPMKTAQQGAACLRDANGQFAVSFDAPVWTEILPEEPETPESTPESQPEEPAEESELQPEEPEEEPAEESPQAPATQEYALELALTNGASADTFQTAFLTTALRFYSKQDAPDALQMSFTAGGKTYTAVREPVTENTALFISGVRWQFRFLDGEGNEKTFSLPGGIHSESGTVRVLLTTAQGAPQGLIPAEITLVSEQF